MPGGVSLAELGLEPPAPRAPERASGAPAALGFQPGLEGLRGVAVAVVLLFHGGFSWAVGGFLGVSTFFTLSGFLITSLLVNEHERSGRIDLRRFWARRFRRLMPAALLCLAGVVLFGATVATPEQLAGLRGDVLAALVYVANWRFIAVDASYAELFSAPSPVLHFWSLAIEEQFYLLFPLLVAGVVAIAKVPRRGLLVTFTVATAASVAYCASLAGSDLDAAYYNTFTRAAELLVGALLALVVASAPVRRRLTAPSGRRVLTVVAALAVLGCAWCWHVARETDLWLYRGGLLAYAVLSATLVLAAVHAPAHRAWLSWPPLRYLGRISYGVYLYHWPIFLWLTPARTGLEPWPLFALRVGVTVAVAVASYHLVEQPIREGRRLTGWRPLLVAPACAGLLVVALVGVTADPPTGQLISFAPAEQPEVPAAVRAEAVDAPTPTTAVAAIADHDLGRTSAGLEPAAAVPPPPPLPEPPAQRPGEALRLYFTGDSGMFTLARGAVAWAEEVDGVSVFNQGRFGCGIGRGGELRFMGELRTSDPSCDEFDWYGRMREIRPHLVVLMAGTWDVVDRRLPGDDTWRSFGDPAYDRFIATELAASLDALQSQGATVVVLTHPAIAPEALQQRTEPYPESDPARMDRYNEIVRDVAATRERVHVLDLAGYLASRPNGEIDLAERPDGVHWATDAAIELGTWLGPQLVALTTGAPMSSEWLELAP